MASAERSAATFNDAISAAVKSPRPRARGVSVKLGTPSTEAEVRAAALAVVPELDGAGHDALRVAVIDGGLTNALFAVSTDERGEKPGMTVLVRVFGESTERVIDRERDGIVFELLSELGVGPALVGTFDNGRVESFIEGGRTLEPGEMGEPGNAAMVGAAVGRFHGVLREEAAAAGPELWRTLDAWLSEAEAVEAEGTAVAGKVAAMFGGEGMAAAGRWLDRARRQLAPMRGAAAGDEAVLRRGPGAGEPWARAAARSFARGTVLCHSDLLGGNLLLVAAERRVQLLDFEYSGPGPRAFDWGNHFGEHAGLDCEFGRLYPAGTEAKMAFLRAYVGAAAPSLAEEAESSGASGAFWDELGLEGDRFAVAGHLFWGLWAVVQARWSAVEFDFAAYAGRRLEGGIREHGAALGDGGAGDAPEAGGDA